MNTMKNTICIFVKIWQVKQIVLNNEKGLEKEVWGVKLSHNLKT
jgi:hypothetical protein